MTIQPMYLFRFRTGVRAALAAAFLAGTAARAGDPILFVAPARPSVLQVLQDVVRRHRGSILVSYAPGSTSDASVLHVWDGRDWTPVRNDDYRRGRFLQTAPKRALLFGPEELLPERLVEDSSWVPLVLNVPELDTATVLNAAGRLLHFRPAEWRWFARRYGLGLQDANEPLREDTWYDQSHEPRRFEPPPVPVPPRRREAAPPSPPPARREAAEASLPVRPVRAEDPAPQLPPAAPVMDAPEERVPALPKPPPAAPAQAEPGIK